jgi:hypothetical protein
MWCLKQGQRIIRWCLNQGQIIVKLYLNHRLTRKTRRIRACLNQGTNKANRKKNNILLKPGGLTRQMGRRRIRACINQRINKENGIKEEYGCQNQEELYWN